MPLILCHALAASCHPMQNSQWTRREMPHQLAILHEKEVFVNALEKTLVESLILLYFMHASPAILCASVVRKGDISTWLPHRYSQRLLKPCTPPVWFHWPIHGIVNWYQDPAVSSLLPWSCESKKYRASRTFSVSSTSIISSTNSHLHSNNFRYSHIFSIWRVWSNQRPCRVILLFKNCSMQSWNRNVWKM